MTEMEAKELIARALEDHPWRRRMDQSGPSALDPAELRQLAKEIESLLEFRWKVLWTPGYRMISDAVPARFPHRLVQRKPARARARFQKWADTGR